MVYETRHIKIKKKLARVFSAGFVIFQQHVKL